MTECTRPAPVPIDRAFTRDYLTDRQEALTRLVHAQGVASLGDMLSAYRARPITVKTMRYVLDSLCDAGWLMRVRDHRRRRCDAVAWRVTEEAMPHFLTPARLPRRPGDVPAAGQAGALPAPYIGAPALPREHEHLRQGPWRPPAPPPLRPGALDFLAIPSHGACR